MSLNTVMRSKEMKKLNIRKFSSLPSWASIDPESLGKTEKPHQLRNFVNGEWKTTEKNMTIICPKTGNSNFIQSPDTQVSELKPFKDSINACSKSGLHNPFKNPERYSLYGDICFKVSKELSKAEIEDFFVSAIRKVFPKSDAQARGEIKVTQRCIKNFCSDNVRFMARGFTVSGDHLGQISTGYRWPFGAGAVIAPFNFPFKLPVLQVLGGLFMGNRITVKASERTSFVLEEFIRLLLHCGMPPTDLNLIHCRGKVMEELLVSSNIRVTQFTGSSNVSEHLNKVTRGKVKIEDAGCDWKILGPDVPSSEKEIDFIASVSDQDAYAASGQKCSAQSMLFVHENYEKKGFISKLKALAKKRSLKEDTISPLLSMTNDQVNQHLSKLLELSGTKLLFGGELSKVESHTIPDVYGSFTPTAVFVPIDTILSSEESLKLCTTEIFAPFQIITKYGDKEVDKVIEVCEKMDNHLTAAVVSNDQKFLHKVLGNTINGSTYIGLRATTTNAPPFHWFGPAGDPRGGGIATPEGIRLVWSCHREIVTDYLLPSPVDIPPQT